MSLSPFSNVYGKRLQGSYASACGFQTRILQVKEMSNMGENDDIVDVCWAAELKSPLTVKSRILPNKTRSNCWLATIRFCMASKQQRRAIKTFRGSILIRDQSLTGNNIKRNALSRNLGIYFHWLTFVVTQIISMSQVRTLLRKQKIRDYKIFNFFANTKPNFSV